MIWVMLLEFVVSSEQALQVEARLANDDVAIHDDDAAGSEIWR